MVNTNNLQQKTGCLAPDTMVTMGDGSIRRIADIRMGDIIMSGDFIFSRVMNIWRGSEQDNMVRIFVGSIRTDLLATKDHPIWVQEPDGTTKWKRAGDCKVLDKVFTESGEYVPITKIIEEKPSDKVCNLELILYHGNKEYEGMMYCNNIRVGDFRIQNSI